MSIDLATRLNDADRALYEGGERYVGMEISVGAWLRMKPYVCTVADPATFGSAYAWKGQPVLILEGGDGLCEGDVVLRGSKGGRVAVCVNIDA